MMFTGNRAPPGQCPRMTPKGQWKEVQERMREMDEEGQEKFSQRLRLTYRQYGIPLEIRDDMAGMIESLSLSPACHSRHLKNCRQKDQLAPVQGEDIDPEEEEAKGREIYEKIVTDLLNLRKNRQFPLNLSLQGKIEEIQNRFRDNPGDLVRNLKNCLIFERLLMESINKESESEVERSHYMDGSSKIADAVRHIRQQSDNFEAVLQNLQSRTATFLKFYSLKEDKMAKIDKVMQGNVTEDEKRVYMREKMLLEEQSGKETVEVYMSRQRSQQMLVQLYDDVVTQVKEVWQYLDLYEKQQKQNVLDIKMGPPEGAVKDLNDMCEAVNEMLVRVMQYFDLVLDECKRIKIVDDPTQDLLLQHQNMFFLEAQQHFDRIVVIDHHPHQILKISKGRSLTFAMTLRILGPVSLGLNVNIPTVTANLHPEKDLQAEMTPGKEVSKGICTIHNASKVKAQYKTSTKQLMVNFSSAQITSVKRPESRSRDERVTEMKYGMIFSVRLNIAAQPHHIKKLSLPMILTSQSSQEWAAKGTLFWDACFSEEKRQFFKDAPKVHWEQIADLLDKIFKGQTKRGLNKDQLLYLAQRVFGRTDMTDFSKQVITKEKFLKESLQNTNFSLWKWVYACLNLIKESLSKEWEKGLIMGFVSRERADALLHNCSAGTFLLRFGTTRLHETQSATITAILRPVAVVALPVGNRVSHMDADLTQQKLSRSDLARYLQLLQVQDPNNKDIKRQALTVLYPDKQFEEAFKDLLHASEIMTENYDLIIEKPEIQIREFSDNSMLYTPASPDSSIASGASVYQDDAVPSPCATVTLGAYNRESDILDHRSGSPSLEVEKLVPTLRINTSDIQKLNFNDLSMSPEANACDGSFPGMVTMGQNTGVKRMCYSGGRGDNIFQPSISSTLSSPGANMNPVFMSQAMAIPTMSTINNMNHQMQGSMPMSQAGYFNNLPNVMNPLPNQTPGLPNYSPPVGSPPYMNQSPSYSSPFNSGPVFSPQMDGPLSSHLPPLKTTDGGNFTGQTPPNYCDSTMG